MGGEITCLDFQNQLDALMKERMGEPERSRLLHHAEKCEECAMILDVERHMALWAPSVLEASVPDDMVRHMWSNVRSQLGLAWRGEQSRWFRWIVPTLSAAAAVLLVLVGILYGENRHLIRRVTELTGRVTGTESEYATSMARGQSPGRHGRMGIGPADWRHMLSDQKEYSVDELLELLSRLPPATELLTSRDARVLSRTNPIWMFIAGYDAGASLNTTDGVQAGEVVRVIESMGLPRSHRISMSRLVNATQPLRSYRNAPHQISPGR